MKPSDALRVHRNEVKDIIEQHHARNVRVFGSVLHHNDTEASDLDLLIDTTPETTLMDIGAIRLKLRKLLGVKVDVLTPKALPDNFRDQVLAQAMPVCPNRALRIPDYLDHTVQAIGRIKNYTHDDISCVVLMHALPRTLTVFLRKVIRPWLRRYPWRFGAAG